MAVTTKRFPNMKHLGDLTKINGAEIEPVDIITFGSPCQDGVDGWNIPFLRSFRVWFDSFDLMDDMQVGLSLKSIEAHLGIPIEETEVDFNLSRSLTEEELEQTIRYCAYDVDATEKLLHLRENAPCR